jgi:hypothetical protein
VLCVHHLRKEREQNNASSLLLSYLKDWTLAGPWGMRFDCHQIVK